jgi:hypothetical protein
MCDGPQRAIRCAMAIRDAVRSLGIAVRAGLHTGECDPSWLNLALRARFARHRGGRKSRGRVRSDVVCAEVGANVVGGAFWRVFRSTPVALCCL